MHLNAFSRSPTGAAGAAYGAPNLLCWEEGVNKRGRNPTFMPSSPYKILKKSLKEMSTSNANLYSAFT